MPLSPAQTEVIHQLARELAAAPASGGERSALVRRAARTLGKSVKTVYALLHTCAGWTSGRKVRADAGHTCVGRELALMAGGLSWLGTRQTGKRILSIRDARERLAANGYGVTNPETGEVTMPSAATLSRAMRRHCCHPRQLAQARPATQLRSLHPNHTWEVDASVCVLYSLKGGGVRLLNEREYNQHKPGKLVEIAGQRIIRYVVADHFSGCFYLRYEQARGEDAAGVIATLVEAMSDRGPRDPLHGAPMHILMDKGSGNASSLVRQFLDDLGITPLWHEAGNPRAKGTVEKHQDIVEKGFESRLRFMEVPSVAHLQAQADAWRQHFNARAILTRAGKPRNQLWNGITDGQLRTVERETLMAIAHWGDVTRVIDNRFHISVNTRSYGVREYDLRELGYHGLSARDTVTVRLNPFRAPNIMVIKALPDGQELRYEVSPIEKDDAGRDASAPVIGQDYRAQPKTRAERNLDAIKMRATGTTNIRDAERALKSQTQRPFAELDPMADVREAPLYLRREGQPVGPLGESARTAGPVPLNRAQAAQRLAAMCGEAWAADPVACNALLRARYPRSVPESALPELAEAINQRFAPRPARVHVLANEEREEATCVG